MSRTHPAARRVAPVLVLVLAVALRAAFLTVGCLLLWAALPTALGWTPSTVVSDSMRPAVAAGDVVVAMPVPPDEVRRGQVVLVVRPDDEGYLLHRVHDTPRGRLELKGDANPTPDGHLVDRADVHGIGVLRVPVVGLPVVWSRNRDTAALGVAGIGVVLGALGVLRTRRYLATDGAAVQHTADADTGNGRSGRRGAARTTIVLLAVVTTAAVVAVLGLVPRAGAAWSGATGNAGSSLATSRYGCMDGSADDAHSGCVNNHPPGTPAPNRGSGPPGVLSGGVARSAGSCADSPHVILDGLTGRIRADAAMNAPSAFTVETWFRTTTAGGMLVGFGSTRDARSGSHDRHLYIGTDGRLVFGVWANGAARTATTPGTVTDGRWHHAVGTMSPTEGLRLHLDGTLVGTNTNTVTQQWTGYWRIGWESLSSWPAAPSDEHYAGALDETRVYLRALTAQEVQAHHDAGR